MGRKARHPSNRKSASAGVEPLSTPVILHPPGFTLIELLVVIAIVAVLMAILLPIAGRVRKQAWAVVCRSNLRQWGVDMHIYASAHDGRLQHVSWGGPPGSSLWESRLWDSGKCSEVALCPMARRPPDEGYRGATFRAWKMTKSLPGSEDQWRWVACSYGGNGFVGYPDGPLKGHYVTILRKGVEGIPYFFDCRYAYYYAGGKETIDGMGAPPEQEDMEKEPPGTTEVCINRHEGGINTCFLDGSVRHVGLKELWMLQWRPFYFKSNRWTKAGGVQPQDWPEWMRKFKDY